ncbi:mitochondrial carrier domain-containing protein [Podospora australis]|uniref:Mitochondrial carrier domain-containing protein n=1 Tax=Podospora australis TaxID=1536484 RepID=A0AAN6WV34_9PEZI|nr:mitochondrial carrier domain-containing protein [Podospora australis]
MSADFWAGYISGAVGIIIGNPLDILKVRLQASSSSSPSPTSSTAATTIPKSSRSFFLGTAAPILTYGALNALLFVSYNRSEAFLNSLSSGSGSGEPPKTGRNLYNTFLAGCVGGLATFFVSTPTELVKCRAQLSSPSSPSHRPSSSWQITKQILRENGIRGLYKGGTVTALRDSIGYGFYFWGYELSCRYLSFGGEEQGNDTARTLVCGGLAGVLTWASIFPLDVIKTRVQTQGQGQGIGGEREGLLTGVNKRRERGAWEVGRELYQREGVRSFFRGLGVCSVRAFVVNAVQWAVYEWIMMELGQGRKRGGATGGGEVVVG